MKHPHIKVLKTTYGKIVRVSIRDLSDKSCDRLPLFNQFGNPLKDEGSAVLRRPLAVYRDNLLMNIGSPEAGINEGRIFEAWI